METIIYIIGMVIFATVLIVCFGYICIETLKEK